MVHAIRIHEYGGPEVMRWEEVEVGDPGAGQVRLRHSVVGVNFIDCYHRSGVYPVASLPITIGMEAAGVVEALGEGVTDLAVGDRVAYASPPLGSYSEGRLMPADRVVKLPDAVADDVAACIMLGGMTAQYLLRRTWRVKAGDRILIHAAAGGVGLMACQWASHLGATVIGTVGSAEKAELARAHGCHHTILYRDEDFVARVKEITGGSGVDVVYDGVGKDTFLRSLDCIRPMGMMVVFGNASGMAPVIDPMTLAAKGSLFLTRPTLMTYTARREDLVAMAAEVFEVVQTGVVKVEINQRYPLAEAARAHADLESRRTTGKSVMEVD